MVKGPLPDRLEFAILQIVMSIGGGKHQNHWGGWHNEVQRLVPDLAQGVELQAAFTRLWKRKLLSLSKWSTNDNLHVEFSGQQRDESQFFYTGTFGAG